MKRKSSESKHGFRMKDIDKIVVVSLLTWVKRYLIFFSYLFYSGTGRTHHAGSSAFRLSLQREINHDN